MSEDIYIVMPTLDGFEVVRERDGQHTVVDILPTRAKAEAKASELATQL